MRRQTCMHAFIVVTVANKVIRGENKQFSDIGFKMTLRIALQDKMRNKHSMLKHEQDKSMTESVESCLVPQ